MLPVSVTQHPHHICAGVTALNRFRRGAAVEDTTFQNDQGSALRFLGWLKQTHGGVEMKLSVVFGSPRLGEWVEGYLQWLKQRDCKNSTLRGNKTRAL